MITNPRFTVLYVGDQQEALDFFTKTLGFEVTTDAPYGEDERWIEVRPPGAQTYLVLSKADPQVQNTIRERLGPMSHVWFECDDLDATFAELTAQGVEFTVEPQVAPWDPSGATRWAQFADPDGNLYGLSRRG
jgi:catechol 2,3-dioxygenase-like lactoylglutathione lyase family enzyme